jgi:undecaprenyl-diphosphatase
MDQELLFIINRQWTSPALDLFMAGVSSFDVWLPAVVLLGLWIVARGSFRTRAFLATALLVVAINDGLVSRMLKRAVDRPRPHQSHNDVRQVDLAKAKPRVLALAKAPKVRLSRTTLEDVDGRSFPSSHTMNTVSVALVAGCFFGRRAGWGFLIPALVGYSRIYTGAHWPSDVLTSIFLGLGATMLWLAIAEWLWRKRAGQLLPRLHAEHPSLLAA